MLYQSQNKGKVSNRGQDNISCFVKGLEIEADTQYKKVSINLISIQCKASI